MLIDFGLAKPLAPHTKDGGANYFGQPNYYLSPEMLKGEPFGLEVDWWMFGVLIYQMMVGAFPWTGRTVPEVHAQVRPRPVFLSFVACAEARCPNGVPPLPAWARSCPPAWEPLTPRGLGSRTRAWSQGAYRALCARCAKSWLFSTTGSSVSSED